MNTPRFPQHEEQLPVIGDVLVTGGEAESQADRRWIHCHYHAFRWGPADLAHLETQEFRALGGDSWPPLRGLNADERQVPGRGDLQGRSQFARVDRGDVQGAVLVFVREPMQDQKGVFRTELLGRHEGLELSYQFERAVRQSSGEGWTPIGGAVGDVLSPLTFRLRHRPLCMASRSATVGLNELPYDLIERGPDVVDIVSEDRAQTRVGRGQVWPGHGLPPGIVRIYISNRTKAVLQIDFDVLPEAGVDGFEMLGGPVELDRNTVQGGDHA